ncbi:MAG: dihydropteroate synthase [Deltaproteobacteria bacterium]|nr:dihydropteroate synthase [Deltaproteobacteria bacterium]
MLLIADNLQITKESVQKALAQRDAKTIRNLVGRCEESGADAIDINTGPLGKNAEDKMKFFVDAVQEVTELPIVIDTANPMAIEAGLKCAKNRAIINGFSLEPKKIEKILPLAKTFDTDIMGYLLTKEGQVPKTATQRLTIASEIHSKIIEEDISEERLIIDPVLVPLIWDDGKNQDFELLGVIRLLPDVLGFEVKTVVGLSNLSAGAPASLKKNIIENSYLSMLAASGLSMVLLNIFNTETVKTAKAIEELLNPGIFSWEVSQ